MSRTIALTLALLAVLAAPAAARLGPNPSNKALASEFLRILQAKDSEALAEFLSPAFLIQRDEGTWLTRSQYLEAPATVESYRVTEVFGNRLGKNLRVIRYTVQTSQTVDGQQYSNDPVPRLSVYLRSSGTWRIISHANFNAPAT